MINEQMLIQELQNERAKAQNEQEDLRQKMELAREKAWAFDRSIDKVQLLLAKQLKDDVQPQLNKAGVMRPLPHDLKLLEELWYRRNPAHEHNADSGEDMFWGTVACVIDDYIAAVHGNGA